MLVRRFAKKLKKINPPWWRGERYWLREISRTIFSEMVPTEHHTTVHGIDGAQPTGHGRIVHENNCASCRLDALPVDTIVHQPIVHRVDCARPIGHGSIAHRYNCALYSLNTVSVGKIEHRSFVHRIDCEWAIRHDSVMHRYKWAPERLHTPFFEQVGTRGFSTKLTVHHRLSTGSIEHEYNFAPYRLSTSTTVHRIIMMIMMMNHGFMVTILKLNNNLHSGSVQTSHGRKKHVKFGAMSRQCWLFFSIVRGLCTANLLQEVRRSTKNITLKFWKDCVMPWEENDRVSGQAVTGFFTTIALQRIHRTLCTASPASVHSSVHSQSRHSSLRLLDVPKIENGDQRKAVRRHRDDSELCDARAEGHSKICVQGLL